MHLLVNALSTTNLSGRYVVLGHLAHLARWTAGRHALTVLYHDGNRDIRREWGPHVQWRRCPAMTRSAATRTLWERMRLPRLCMTIGVDAVLHTSGMTVPGVRQPQSVLAQNPWCLVPGIAAGGVQSLKAALQRRAYRRTMRDAALIAFLSEFLRDAYRRNAGCTERDSVVAYPGLDADVLEAVARMRGMARSRYQVLSVSVMAPHKNVETTLRAVALLRQSHGIPAQLVLAGPWPDRQYEARIKGLARSLGIEDSVAVRGQLPRDELLACYASARVFCLMSRCESFGIPAVEAQAFGTPVVSSDCCAVSEVCGAGGLYAEPSDLGAVADALAKLLRDESAWQRLSQMAAGNAARFQWDQCSRPLMRVLGKAEQVDKAPERRRTPKASPRAVRGLTRQRCAVRRRSAALDRGASQFRGVAWDSMLRTGSQLQTTGCT